MFCVTSPNIGSYCSLIAVQLQFHITSRSHATTRHRCSSQLPVMSNVRSQHLLLDATLALLDHAMSQSDALAEIAGAIGADAAPETVVNTLLKFTRDVRNGTVRDEKAIAQLIAKIKSISGKPWNTGVMETGNPRSVMLPLLEDLHSAENPFLYMGRLLLRCGHAVDEELGTDLTRSTSYPTDTSKPLVGSNQYTVFDIVLGTLVRWTEKQALDRETKCMACNRVSRWGNMVMGTLPNILYVECYRRNEWHGLDDIRLGGHMRYKFPQFSRDGVYAMIGCHVERRQSKGALLYDADTRKWTHRDKLAKGDDINESIDDYLKTNRMSIMTIWLARESRAQTERRDAAQMALRGKM